jgi:phosphate transport system substrate-binding protein
MHVRFRGIAETAVSTLLLTIMLQAAADGKDDKREIRVAGSTTLAPILEEVGQKYQRHYPFVQFAVRGGGSTFGIAKVGRGEIQLGLSSRALTGGELHRYPDLRPVKIGIDGIALVVHSENPVAHISRRQVQDIFTGKTANWSVLGGRDAPIVPLSVGQRHGTFDVFCDYFSLAVRDTGNALDRGPTLYFGMKGTDDRSPSGVVVFDNTEKLLTAIAAEPNGVAYLSLGSASRAIERDSPLRILQLDGVAPTASSVRDGSYRLQRPLLVITKGPPDDVMDLFLHYLLSSAGQRIVEKLGCVSLRGQNAD